MKPLCIIGKGRGWIEATEDETRDKWIVSSAYFHVPTVLVDKIFQLHHPLIWEPYLYRIRDRVVIAWDKEGFEDCEHLPVSYLVREFGPVFPSSISWMLAYALTTGYRDITIAGVDMEHRSEYGVQRDYLMYMMGVAVGRGAKVHIPPTNGMFLHPQIYGVEENE